MRKVLLLTCLLMLGLGVNATADCPNHVTLNGSADTYYGQSVAVIGDITGDGVDDYIVGAPNGTEVPINYSGLGRAYVYSGADPNGTPIWSGMGQYYMPSDGMENGQYGYCVSGAGDVNGDGTPDFMVGAPNWRQSGTYWRATGRVKVYSGDVSHNNPNLNFPIINPNGLFRVGTSLACVGDINGDGRDDIVIGAPKNTAVDGDVGHAYVYGYVWNEAQQQDEWTMLWDKAGSQAAELFGTVVSGAGDVNGDQVPDFMAVSTHYGYDQGIVFVFSGADGEPIWTYYGSGSGIHFGRSLSALGDVNGDTYDDFLIAEQGYVFCYSGQTGEVLHTYGSGNSSFGTSVSTAGDYDDDGVPDILISKPEYSSMHIFSGATAQVIQNITGGGTDFGTSVAGPRGTLSDGYGITIGGAPGSDQAYVFSCGYPDADIEAVPGFGYRPLDVQFTANSSADVTAWSWDFGDGGNSDVEDPSHEYQTSGLFTVALTMTGFKGQRTETVPNLVNVWPVPPVAAFGATPTSGERPLTVQFTDLTVADVDTWYWDFGDGTYSGDENPVHVYQNPNSYTVSLTVTNVDGSDTETKTNYITVTHRTIWVDAVNGSDATGDGTAGSPYATIQTGINHALENDTVMVKAGTYSGTGNVDMHFPTNSICVIGENGPEQTIIDPQGLNRAFAFLGRSGTVDGFTIQNGNALNVQNTNGGAIFSSGQPVIKNCIIKGCQAELGAGVYIQQTQTGQATLTGVLFYDNTATNSGGALRVDAGDVVVQNCTFADNSATSGAAIGVGDQATSLALDKSIVAFNEEGVNCGGASTNVTFDCDIFWENTNGHVVGGCTFPTDPLEATEVDPQFCNRDGDDYSVFVGSPCDPEQSLCGELVGALEPACSDLGRWRVDMGKVDNGYMGEVVPVPIYITEPESPTDLGYIEFRINWDQAAMMFLSVTPGDFLTDCGWDYWTYRYKSSPFPHLQVYAYAQTGGEPPTCYHPSGKQKVFDISFLLTTQSSYSYTYYPVNFVWPSGIDNECEVNIFKDVAREVVYMADTVFSWLDSTIPDGTPTYAPTVDCQNYAQRVINFHDGYVYFVDMLGPSVRGDLNLNTIRFDAGDWVLFACAMANGPENCFNINYDAQMDATDIDCDGEPMEVEDYILFERILFMETSPRCPDEPLAKVTTSSDTLKILSTSATQGQHNKGIEIYLANQEDLAGLQARFEYDPAVMHPVSDTVCANGYCVQYELEGRLVDYDEVGDVNVQCREDGELLITMLPDSTVTGGIPAGSGAILKVYFNIPGAAPLGEHVYAPVNQDWKRNRVATPDPLGIDPELVGGTIYVLKSLPPPSCPVLYTFDGSDYRQENPLLTACEESNYQQVVTDYYHLQDAPALSNGRVSLQLREQEDEVTYLDDFKLMTVDHSASTQVAVSVDGQIMTYQEFDPPVAAIDNNGVDRLAEIVATDGHLFRSDEAGYLIVAFANYGQGTKGFTANTATKYKCLDPLPHGEETYGKSEPGQADHPRQISVELLDAHGNWIQLPQLPPRSSTREEVLITGADVLSSGELVTLRLSWPDSYQTDAVVQLVASNEHPTVTSWSPGNGEVDRGKGAPDFWQDFGVDGRLTLKKGDVASFDFAPTPLTESGRTRDYVIVAKGRYEPDYSVHTQLLPDRITLEENYPNPFNPSTTISYAIPQAGQVRVEIYNVLGQVVSTLVNEYQPAGFYQVDWNADGFASGVYFYRLTVGNFVETKKMILAK
jgi:PKD repeat protein